jgi:hypothetical protein
MLAMLADGYAERGDGTRAAAFRERLRREFPDAPGVKGVTP